MLEPPDHLPSVNSQLTLVNVKVSQEQVTVAGGAVFNISDGQGVDVTFSEALDAAGLRAAFGDIDEAALNAALEAPAGGMAAITATGTGAGLGYVDDLFRLDDGGEGIAVADTLPAELL